MKIALKYDENESNLPTGPSSFILGPGVKSDKRSETSAMNGRKGGRPKGAKNKPTKVPLEALRTILELPDATVEEALSEVSRLKAMQK